MTWPGVVVSNCSTVANASNCVTGFAFGLAAGTGTNFSQCLVENCFVYGSTTGIAAGGYLCDQTLYRNNTVYGGTNGIADTNTDTNIAANAFYVNNFCAGGTLGITIVSTGNGLIQCMGNYVNDAGEGHIYAPVYVRASTE